MINLTNIKFFAFSKYTASLPIYSICPDIEFEDQLKTQVSKVILQAKNLNLRPQQRQKFNTKRGCWFCKKDNKDFLYLMLCSANYPQRHAFAAINLLRDHMQGLSAYESAPQSSLRQHSKLKMQQITKKYQSLRNIDKIAIANQNVQQLRSSVGQSTRKMLDNQVQLEDLQKKSESLRDHANQFQQNAGELERIMWWRNCKIKILIAVVIVCVILIIVIPIVVTSKK